MDDIRNRFSVGNSDTQQKMTRTELIIQDRERRESGFGSDGSLSPFLDNVMKELVDRRESCDSGLSQSPPDLDHMPKSQDKQEKRKKKKKKRLCESTSVSHFEDLYKLTGEVLGEGSYGKVQTCVNIFTNVEYAVKIISKQSWHFSRPKILKEIELYYLCQGRTEIIQMVEYFEEFNEFFLVFEKAVGGPLLNQIQRRVHFTEKEAATIIRDLAKALAFLHGRGIAHRDLKPENVLCSGDGDDFLPIKLCDFDLCSACYQTITTPKLQSPVGSVEYMAPEVVEAFAFDMDIFDSLEDLELSYDKRCDLWSLGIIAYILLCGYLPFNGSCGEDCGWKDRGEECQECQHRLFSAITSGTLMFPDEHWSGVSKEAKDLIAKLLVRDASQRIDAESILRHPWIVSGGDCQPVELQKVPLETPKVLRTRHRSVHNLFYSEFASNALAIKRNCHESKAAMKKSSTVIDFQASPAIDILPPSRKTPKLSVNERPRFTIGQVDPKAVGSKMRRQTSLVVFPDEHCRWEF